MHTSRKLTHSLMALVALVVLASAAMAQTIVGPGTIPGTEAMVSDQKAGSILFYLYYESSSTTAGVNTRINITNTHPQLSAFVHVFFFNACSPADAYLCLTPSQTMSFTTLDYDPDAKGYVAAVAVDGGTAQNPGSGCPVRFNWLIGDEFIKTTTINANLGAEAVAARFGVNDNDRIGGCANGSLTAELVFDGNNAGANSYDALGQTLAIDNIPSRLDGNKVRITIVSPTNNENSQAGPLNWATSGTGSGIGTLVGVAYDEAEQPFSFTLSVTCGGLVEFAPRLLGGGIDQVIGSGRSGWARFWVGSSSAILGAVFTTNSGTGSNAFTGGHTLHKLTVNRNQGANRPSAFMPLFVPAC